MSATGPADSTQSKRSLSRLQIAIAIALLAGLSILVEGYHFGYNNQYLQLPLIFKLRFPHAFPGDVSVDSLKWYMTYFYHPFALLPTSMITAAYLVLHIALRICAVWAFFWVARFVTRTDWAALAGTAIFAISAHTHAMTPCAYDEILASWFAHTPASLAAALLAFGLFLRGRIVLASLVCGLLANLNLMVAGTLFGVMMAAELAQAVWDRRLELKTYVAGIAVFVVSAAPMLAWVVRRWTTAPEYHVGTTREFTSLLMAWFPVHYFPSSWSKQNVVTLACMIALAAIAFTMTRDRIGKKLWFVLGALGVVWIANYGLTVVHPVRSIIVMHLFRSEKWFVLLAILGGIVLIERLSENRSKLALAAGIVLMAGLMLPFGPHSLGLTRVRVAVLLLAGGVLAAAALRRQYSGNGKQPVALAMVVVGLLGALVGFAHRTPSTTNAAWQDITTWCREHTAASAVFIVPPSPADDFRAYAHRTSVIELKDGGQIAIEPGFETVYTERMHDLGADVSYHPIHTGGYTYLTAPDFEKLCAKYRAPYVITKARQKLDSRFVVVYHNSRYNVFTPRDEESPHPQIPRP